MSTSTNAPIAAASPLLPVVQQFLDIHTPWDITPFGNGLINSTWKVGHADHQQAYILQKINTTVFPYPGDIATNIQRIGAYLQKEHPDYFFVRPLPTHQGAFMLHWEKRHWYRLSPFVQASHTVDTVSTPQQAYEAARQFGHFTRHLQHFPSSELRITLPHFHNLSLRYHTFCEALAAAPAYALQGAQEATRFLQAHSHLVHRFENLVNNSTLPLRVIHHDTKISNTLFDQHQKGMCVIDLDTVMPGYYISDVGDMCRTYLCPLSEESTDFDAITIRLPYYEAMATGYLEAMGPVLTPAEWAHFSYAGPFIIYMQALRFATDHLMGNVYYPVKHPLHNLHRTQNQIALLQAYMAREKEIQAIVDTLRSSAGKA